MKKSVTNTTLGLIALATMSFAASNVQANHDNSSRYDRDYGPRHGQRVNQQHIAEINARQAQQLNRIEQGMRNGTLTRREYRTLMSELQNFDAVKRDFMSDGFLTPSEFRQLDNGLDAAARNIRMEKRDHDTRASNYDNSRYGQRWGYNR